MIKCKLILTLVLLPFALFSIAQDVRTYDFENYINFSGGINKNRTPLIEILFSMKDMDDKIPIEGKLGLNFHSQDMPLNGIKHIGVNSLGAIIDLSFSPFKNYANFYIGLRWEVVNINWVKESSSLLVSKNDPFFATSLYGSAGLTAYLSPKVNISFFVRPGFQLYETYEEHFKSLSKNDYGNPKIAFLLQAGISINLKTNK